MIVAASNSNWLPRFLGIIGRLRSPSAENGPSLPSDAETSSGKSDAPINAIVLSTALPIFYILFGDFRALLTFNGLGEYTFFLLTVLGAIVLRFREPGLRRPYKPSIIIPITFAIVSGFVVVRGAIFAPVQALVLLSLWIIGVGWKRGTLMYGFIHVMRVFRRVVIIATGSGIGPCLSWLSEKNRPPLRVLWQTRNPGRTYGSEIGRAHV